MSTTVIIYLVIAFLGGVYAGNSNIRKKVNSGVKKFFNWATGVNKKEEPDDKKGL